MYTRTFKFTDFNGVEREEEHNFYLSQAELIEFLTTSGDYTLDVMLKKLIYEDRNGKEIMKIFKDLIYNSYGKKSLDGRRFIKSKEVKDDFMETEAYSILFTDLIVNAEEAAKFINGIIPTDLANALSKQIAENPGIVPAELRDYMPAGTN